MVNWASYVAVAQNISCNMIFIQSTVKWHLAAARKWAIQSRIFNFDSMYNNTYLSEIESFLRKSANVNNIKIEHFWTGNSYFQIFTFHSSFTF